MYETNYHRASSSTDAVKLLKKADDGKLLGGGMTLIPTMKQRLAAPTDLIDLAHCKDMQGIKSASGAVTVGAATTHAEVATSKSVAKAIPALAELASHIGDPHVRNRGTIGGSIANNDPAADYPSAVLALNAEVKTNKRTIKADKFFNGMFETNLKDDEVVKSVSFKKPKRAAYAKFPNPASRYAMTGVFVADYGKGDVRVAITGAGQDGVYRDKAMEKALSAKFDAGSLDGISVSASNMLSDIHGSAEYRANLVKVMAQRAVKAAASRK